MVCMDNEEIELFYEKSVPENANFYYDKSKKLKRKMPGIEKTIEKTKKEICELERGFGKVVEQIARDEKIAQIKRMWYEKFRFSWTSSGVLFVFGKDSTSNEVIVKKYARDDEFVFHTMYPGSPFGVLKPEEGQVVVQEDILEAGQIILAFSKVWKQGYGAGDFFYVRASQVSKKAVSGEYVKKGSFMIYGDKNIVKNVPLRLSFGYYVESFGFEDGDIEVKRSFVGTMQAAGKFCEKFVNLEPGEEKQKELFKKIKSVLGIDSRDFPSFIPVGSKMLKK